MSDSNESLTSGSTAWNWGNSEAPTGGYGQFNTGSWQNPAGTPQTGDPAGGATFPSPAPVPPQPASASPTGYPNPNGAPQPGGAQFGAAQPNPYFDQYALNFQQVQPGIIPLRPLNLGEIFNGTFSAMRQAPAVMFGLILSIWAVFAVFSGILTALAFPDLTVTEQQLNNTTDGTVFLKLFSEIMQGSIISMIPSAFIQLIASGVTTGIAVTAIAPMVLGRRLSVAETWQETKPHLPLMIGYAFLYSFISLAIYAFAFSPLLMLIPGVTNEDFGMVFASMGLTLLTMFGALFIWAFIYVRLLFVYPAMVMENLGLKKAMARSWKLAKGSFWRLFGIMLLALVLQNVILTGLSFVVQLITGGVTAATLATGTSNYGLTMGITMALSSLMAGVFIPFFSGIQSLLYIDVRMRREGLALSLLRAAQQD